MESVRFISDKSTAVTAVAAQQSRKNHHEEEDGRVLDETGEVSTSTSAKWNRVALIRQLLAAWGAVVGSISFGMTTGFTSTLLPNLSRADDTILVDKSMESWIAGSVVLCMLIGVISGGICMRYLGRRATQLCLYMCWICGWLAVSYARNVLGILAGCVLVGLSAGSHSVVSSVYIGEVCEPRYRGLIGVQISLGVAAGILVSHAQGVLFDWRTALRISAALPTVALALVLAFACESPTWLAFNGRLSAAKNVFLRLRNSSSSENDELNDLIEAATATATATAGVDSVGRRRGRSRIVRELFSSKAFRKSFVVLNVLFVVQQGSGLNAIVFYAVAMLEAMSTKTNPTNRSDEARSDLNHSLSMIAVDTVRFFASLAACVLIKVTGRRKLYFWSASGSILSLCAVIVSTIYRCSADITVLFVCAYVACLYVGVSPIPWIMVGELYPTNLKEFGICVSSFCCFITMFAVVKTALLFISILGTVTTFAMYVVVMLSGVIFLYFHMPETNNVTLQQIEKNLSV